MRIIVLEMAVAELEWRGVALVLTVVGLARETCRGLPQVLNELLSSVVYYRM